MEQVPRKNAYSPRSANWTLYDPKPPAERLDKAVEEVDLALEETGFNKAVRIREYLIKWKTNLLEEQKQLANEQRKLQEQLSRSRQRGKEVGEMLVNIRNILRIARGKGEDSA